MTDSTTTPSAPAFTARQIADALSTSRQAVQRRLERVRESRVIIVAGNEAKAWTFDALPIDLQQRLENSRDAGGFRSVAELLGNRAVGPEVLPALPECHPADIDTAVKLRAALERALAGRDNPLLTGAALVELGLADYKRTFGHVVTERHWRRLFQRTLTRAGTSPDFTALELYLPDKPRKKPESAPEPADGGEEYPGLADIRQRIRSFADPLQPTAVERELVWTCAFDWINERIAEGGAAIESKRLMLDFLEGAAPWLARSRDSLRVLLNKRLSNPAALRDRRVAANEQRARVLDMEEMGLQVYTAVRKFRGRHAPAAREVCGGQPGSRKSYVPETTRREVAPMIAALAPHQQGPRAADKASPSMNLSYDGIRPMDCLVIDDATWNVYIKWPLPDGGWKLTRGQIILIIDFRTLRVLRFGIIPEEQPNSLLAYTVTTNAMAEFGIPKALYIERGKVFADSKLMTGGSRVRQEMRLPGWENIPPAEREFGLQRLGIRIIVARRARSKAVELVIGLLQNLTDGEVGYCGRNERFDRPESLTRLLKEAASSDPQRRERSLAEFYTIEEWADRFWEHVGTYNTTPQEGKHLCGLSPMDAFTRWMPQDEITKLDAACRHWLTHHRKPIEVCGGAVSFTLRGEKFTYRHESLSPLEGRKVLAWLDPTTPEEIIVTDLKHRNPIAIERCQQPNALAVLLDEADPVLAKETAKIQRHQRYWAGVHRTL